MLYLVLRCEIIILNWSIFIAFMIKLLFISGWNICIVFFLESCIKFFNNCFCLSGFFKWIWWNNLGVKFGIFVNFKVLFWVKVLLIWIVLWLCKLIILFVYVFFVWVWLFVIKVSVFEIIIFLLMWMCLSFIFFLYLFEIICIKVMWLWCFGFIFVWILNIKLLNFFFEFFIVWVFVWCGCGFGVYLVKLFKKWFILKLLRVVLKNIGVSLLLMKVLWLNLLFVFWINFSLLCNCWVKLLFIVVFNFGLFKFLIICIFWMIEFCFDWYK